MRTFKTILLARFQGIAGVLFRTRAFVPILILCSAAGSILSWVDQGKDLLRSATDADSTTLVNFLSLSLCFSATFLALQGWFWARVIVEEEFGKRRGWPYSLYLVWAPRIIGTCPFILLAIAVWNSKVSNPWLIVALSMCGTAFLSFVWVRVHLVRGLRLVAARRKRKKRLVIAASITVPLNRLRKLILVGSLVCSAIAVLFISIDPVRLPVFFGPAAVVLSACGLIIPVFTSLFLIGRRFHVRILTVLVAIAIFFGMWVDNHAVRLSGPVVQRPLLVKAYKDWVSQFQNSGKAIPMIFIASEGGASRAGYWTAAVMSQLEKESRGEFSKHVFAVSSISGGSLGVAGFIGAIKDKQTQDAIALGKFDLRASVADFVGRDYLSPALAGMLFPDLVQRFLPFHVLPDRSQALEVGWERGWADHCRTQPCDDADLFSEDFLGLWKASPNLIPVWLIGGALVEDGRPVLTSSVDFGDTIDAWDFHSLTNQDVRLSTAVLNGARFPYVSAGGSINNPNTPQPVSAVHIVDGGYFDAAGVESVRELAQSMFAPGGIAEKDNVHPIFILITNDGFNPPFTPNHGGQERTRSLPEACRGDFVGADCPDKNVHGAWVAPDLFGPLQGLYEGRSAHGERLKALLYRFPPARTAAGTQTSVLPIDLCIDDVPMNWALSGTAKRNVDALLTHRELPPKDNCEKTDNQSIGEILRALQR